MGRRTERSRAYISDAAKNLSVSNAEQRRNRNEASLAEAERLLGTDAQVAGELGGNPELAPFQGRYSFNEGFATSTLDILSRGNEVRDGLTISQLLGKNVGEANTLLEQAQAAAEAGDFDTAHELKLQAEGVVDSGNYYPIIDAAAVQEAITFQSNPIADARARLSSPSAQAVGGIVSDARDLLDYDSETSQRFRGNLDINAERSIATERRGAERQIRDAALSAGGKRNPAAFASIQARSNERFASVRAQVLTENARYFEEFSRAYAQDALTFSQQWLQNSAGFRETFQSSLDRLTELGVNGFANSSAVAERFSAESGAERARVTGRGVRIAIAVLGVVAGALTGGGLGAIIGAATAGGSKGDDEVTG